MLALILGLLLSPFPADSVETLDQCLALAPSQTQPAVTWSSDVETMWTDHPPVSRDAVRASLGELRKARECFVALDALEVDRPYLDNLLRTFSVEAAHLASLRRFEEAFQTLEQARSYLDTEPAIPSTEDARTGWASTLHQKQGYLHFLIGDLSPAITHYLNAFRKTPEEEPAERVKYLVDVGILHQRTQDYESARHYYNRAERTFAKSALSMETHPVAWARTVAVQADLLLEETLNTEFNRDSLERARTLAQRAKAAAEPGTERHARASSVLSESLGYLGAFDEAYPLSAKVRQHARENDNARLQTFALLKLGVLHVQTEHFARADTVLHDALGLAESLGDLDYQRRIYRALGRLHEIQGDWPDAERAYREGIAVVEQYRESLTASQWSMTAFAQWRDVHRGLVRVLLAQDRPREALATLDRSRARHLQDLRTQDRVANELPPETRTRFDSLTRELTEVRNRLDRELSSDVAAELRNREARLIAARQQVLQLDSKATGASLEAIWDALEKQDRQLVSYFIDDPWPVYERVPRSVAFVVTPNTVRTVPLPHLTQDSVQAHVEAVSPLFSSRGKPDRTNAMHFDLRPLHRLHEALYAPVAEHLSGEKPLTVIPDGPLFHLPFSMLVDSMPGGRFTPSEARFLVHDQPISLELSSSLVADTATHPADWTTFDPQIAAYGVSDFDTLETVSSALRTALPDAVSSSSLALPSLPGVRQELRSLESTISGTEVALNGGATETAFCQSMQRAGILHVASHAIVNASSPLRNAILLRPDEQGATRGDVNSEPSGSSDGILFLHELQSQQSEIPMVVLSGCSTARGTLRGGEGMEGLQYAFRAMGAQSTVSTLWPVADEASVELMASFYRHLQAGHSKDRALRQAQLEYVDTHAEMASPFFWAPPVLYGSPEPIPLKSSSVLPWWAWGLVSVIGIFLLGLLVWWQRDRSPGPFRHGTLTS